MESYRKPIISNRISFEGITPLAPLAAMSAKALTVVGVAAGLFAGASSKGGIEINNFHYNALTNHKNFNLEVT